MTQLNLRDMHEIARLNQEIANLKAQLLKAWDMNYKLRALITSNALPGLPSFPQRDETEVNPGNNNKVS